MSASVTNEQFATNKADALRQRLERQLLIIKKRCEALTMRASEVASDNSGVRLHIDDLRKEKILHRDTVVCSASLTASQPFSLTTALANPPPSPSPHRP